MLTYNRHIRTVAPPKSREAPTHACAVLAAHRNQSNHGKSIGDKIVTALLK
jgi:hypothetical protein